MRLRPAAVILSAVLRGLSPLRDLIEHGLGFQRLMQ